MSKTVHAIYNIEFEDLGFIKSILSKKKIMLHEHRAFSQSNLVQPCKEDILIIMGGPMSVNDEKKYPFIKRELEIIQKHLENNGKIIGICLGAQLLAKALGSKVYRGLKKEIGWEPKESFNTGIQKTIEWYLKNEEWWKTIQENTYKQERLGTSN